MNDIVGNFYKNFMVGVIGLVDKFGINEIATCHAEEDYIGLKMVSYECEGDGNCVTTVVKFTVDRVDAGFARFVGTYSSWNDTEWHKEEICQVRPVKTYQIEYLHIDETEDKNFTIVQD